MKYTLYTEIEQLVTLEQVAKKDGRHIEAKDLGVIFQGAVAVDRTTQRIVWVGKTTEIPPSIDAQSEKVATPQPQVWLPELVECHTHLIFGGCRHGDFSKRCEGQTYAEIAAQGGGILTTMEGTRKASAEQLLDKAIDDLNDFKHHGVGIVEIKSGYGLTLESELKVLSVIARLKQDSSMELVSTFLPAHATPPEFKGKTQDYVKEMREHWIPEVGRLGLAEFFDVFVEEGFFTVAQAVALCEQAKAFGMKIKLHTDQFNSLGGVEAGIALGATSLDHLDAIGPEAIRALAKSPTTAVLCPGASLFAGSSYPPARALIDRGARVALSTDYNPGTCPSKNLPLMTTLGATAMKMTLPEVIAAITYNAAVAIDRQKDFGSIGVGKIARFAKFYGHSYEQLPYHFGETQFVSI